MTKLNVRVLWIFLGGLSLVVLAYAGWDVWLINHEPPGSSISSAMVLLGWSHPFLVFVIGYVLGGLHWGLVCHFWAGMPKPPQR